VAVPLFWAKEVLVGSGGLGVSRIFPENLPPQALHHPFSPLFLPLAPFLQFFLPLNASLQLSSSGLYQPLLPSYPPFSPSLPSYPLKSLIGPPPNTFGIPP